MSDAYGTIFLAVPSIEQSDGSKVEERKEGRKEGCYWGERAEGRERGIEKGNG